MSDNQNKAMRPAAVAFRLWIEQIRRAQDLNFAGIADRAGISRSTLSRYYTGQASGLPDMATIEKLAQHFGPPPVALLPPLAPDPAPPAAPAARDGDELVASEAGLSADRFDPEISHYRVTAGHLTGLNVEPGDKLAVRPEERPGHGDLVVVRDHTTSPAALRLARYFMAGGLQLLVQDLDLPPQLADGQVIEIEATVIGLERAWRR